MGEAAFEMEEAALVGAASLGLFFVCPYFQDSNSGGNFRQIGGWCLCSYTNELRALEWAHALLFLRSAEPNAEEAAFVAGIS